MAAKKATKKKVVKRRGNPLYAYQVSVIQPGAPARALGGFPAHSRADALKMAEAELRRKGQWSGKTKLITAAVPLSSTAARHKNKTVIKAGRIDHLDVSKVHNGRRRNVAGFMEASGAFHPLRESGDYDRDRAGETGGKPRRTRSKKTKTRLKKAASTARFNAQKRATSSVKAAASRRLARTTSTGKRLTKKRNPPRRNSGQAEANRREFAGAVTDYQQLYFPEGTPQGLSTLGPLVLLETDAGTIAPTGGKAVLCQDTAGKLYIGALQNAPLIDGAARNFGKVRRVEYICAKPHLGYPGKVTWFHDFEDPLPSLKSDGRGGLHFHGGGYTIRREGITG